MYVHMFPFLGIFILLYDFELLSSVVLVQPEELPSSFLVGQGW